MTKTIGFIKTFTLISVLALFGLSCGSAKKSDLPVIQLMIDGHKVVAEVANTDPTRMAGLMFRRDMGENNGMLFVFTDSQPRAFWMKNTLIPLSIAFVDEQGKIKNILEMPPQTEQTFRSAGSAKYALEMNAGWFSNMGVKAGDSITDITQAPAAKN